MENVVMGLGIQRDADALKRNAERLKITYRKHCKTRCGSVAGSLGWLDNPMQRCCARGDQCSEPAGCGVEEVWAFRSGNHGQSAEQGS